MPQTPRRYQLTPQLVAAHAGAMVLCLSSVAFGRSFDLYADRPGPSRNMRAYRVGARGVAWRADLPSGAAHRIEPVEALPSVIMVRISGALEQRAGYQGVCGGWTDGHDAVADRLCAAFAEGDVLLVIDSPGGAAAGLQQAVHRALAAKAEHGRRCTVFADEMIGSAAMWWACAIGDELFVPPAGQVGSIGARGEHASVAGALQKEGVVVSHFVWPDDGKIAFAPDRPLDDTGRARGDRDVEITGEAFCAAVCESPLGRRHGLDRDAIRALGADMLTGDLAVAAGLADGVESFDSVVQYAFAMAESEPGSDARKVSGAVAPQERAA